jgi:hypothetical protein
VKDALLQDKQAMAHYLLELYTNLSLKLELELVKNEEQQKIEEKL